MVFTRVWQYEVVEGRESEFERVYAGDGAWAGLFESSEDFLGTELFRSLGEARGYLTVDRFTSAEAFRRFLAQHATAYAELDRQTQALTVSEQEIEPPRHVGRLQTLGRLESCLGTRRRGTRLS